MRNPRLLPRLFAVIVLSATASASTFVEDFVSPSLDPAWSVWQYSTPANSYSLSANPGFLRYSLSPLSHPYAYSYDFAAAAPGVFSGAAMNPGTEIHRTVSGNQWVLETGAVFYLPYTNGRDLDMFLYLGDGDVGTYIIHFARGRDVNQNYLRILLDQRTGALPWDYPTIQDYQANYDILGPDTTAFQFRLERSGGLLTAQYRPSGGNWTTAWSQDMGTAIDGLQQRLTLSGGSWFNTGGSYADWDYVQMTDTPEPDTLALLACGLLGVVLRRRATRCGPPAP